MLKYDADGFQFHFALHVRHAALSTLIFTIPIKRSKEPLQFLSSTAQPKEHPTSHRLTFFLIHLYQMEERAMSGNLQGREVLCFDRVKCDPLTLPLPPPLSLSEFYSGFRLREISLSLQNCDFYMIL
jgi:hypothetical protein